jgi:small subunit ribosomal protein S4
MRLLKSKEKKERSLGTKLGLKAYRCNSPKCAIIRRPTRPGMHTRPGRGFSEFKQQLMEKQKIRFSYGLTEKQMSAVVAKALAKKKTASVTGQIVGRLESRLDNVAYRLGFAPSRIVARQLISHGHFMVKGKKVTIPSYILRVGEVVSIREQSRQIPLFKDLTNILKGENPENWLTRDVQKLEGFMKSTPEGVELPFDINLVIDYYSR